MRGLGPRSPAAKSGNRCGWPILLLVGILAVRLVGVVLRVLVVLGEGVIAVNFLVVVERCRGRQMLGVRLDLQLPRRRLGGGWQSLARWPVTAASAFP
jgi:hypothetical protein